MWAVHRIAFTAPPEIDYYIAYPHNIYAHALADFGLVGVAAGIIVVVFLAALIRDGIRDADPFRRRFAWASLFATAYLAGHQLVDEYVGAPSLLFALALSVGYRDAAATRPLLAWPFGRP